MYKPARKETLDRLGSLSQEEVKSGCRERNPSQSTSHPSQSTSHPSQSTSHPSQSTSHQPEHQPPQPEHQSPQPEHQPPQPEHHPPQPEHHPPQPEHQSPQPEHQPPQPEHQPPQPEHHPPQPEHQSPQPEHQSPQPEHQPPQPKYSKWNLAMLPDFIFQISNPCVSAFNLTESVFDEDAWEENIMEDGENHQNECRTLGKTMQETSISESVASVITEREGEPYSTFYPLTCPLHSKAYEIECFQRAKKSADVIHPEMGRGHSNFPQARNNVLTRYRSKSISLKQLGYCTWAAPRKHDVVLPHVRARVPLDKGGVWKDGPSHT
ncbi:hypothetical protein Bbelb_290680 [Branchiostoma belcheri]|nr:hypothetical protein Bbelb_290680 [Branchiostoma belcheri]